MQRTVTSAPRAIVKVNIGLAAKSRAEVGRMLNLILADEYILYATTRDYHWNVTGPEFHSLHLEFETQYGQIAQWIDDVAERARAIGIGARGNWAELTKSARSSAASGIGLAAEGMISELLGLHEQLIVKLRADIEACSERHKDAGTADFFTKLMEDHEKVAWMLRSHLESWDEES